MRELVSPDPAVVHSGLRYIRFWLNSIALHTVHRRDEGALAAAPIALVGTYKDAVPGEEDHKNISALLLKTFSGLSAVWSSLIEYEQQSLVFFPVDNTLSGGPSRDPAVIHLMQAMEKSFKNEDYVNAKMPAGWLREMCPAVSSGYERANPTSL
jgi:hypothetical protein